MQFELRIEELLNVVVMEGVNGPDKIVFKLLLMLFFPIIP